MHLDDGNTGGWLKLCDAARALGVSEITLRRRVKGGIVPHDFRDGKYYVHLQRDASGRLRLDEGSSGYPTPDTCGMMGRSETPTSTLPRFSSHTASPGLRHAGVPSAASLAASTESAVLELMRIVKNQERTLQALQRELEDQQTFIALLEENVQELLKRSHSNR